MSDITTTNPYPYGQDWQAQLKMRRAEAAVPLEDRGEIDPRWTGGKTVAHAVTAAAVDLDVLADKVLERVLAAVDRQGSAPSAPETPPAGSAGLLTPAPPSAVTGV